MGPLVVSVSGDELTRPNQSAMIGSSVLAQDVAQKGLRASAVASASAVRAVSGLVVL